MTLTVIAVIIYVIVGLIVIDVLLLLLLGLFGLIERFRKGPLPFQKYVDNKIAKGQVYANGYYD